MRWIAFGSLTALAACEPPIPAHPTWADVEPILRGNCTGCHGADPAAGGGVRFDFFALDEQVCGDAARAVDAPHMARELAPLIAAAITPSGSRARMPPSPAPDLSDGERETLLRWAADPQLGAPRDNHKPEVALPRALPGDVDDQLDLTLVVDDPDGESVVGVLEIGPQARRLDGPGAFRVTIRTASWPAGHYPATATLCDGWAPVSYALPEVVVAHAQGARASSTSSPK